MEDYKIHLLDTDYGQIRLSTSAGEWFSEIQHLALCGDRRFKKTKAAIVEFDEFIAAVGVLHRTSFKVDEEIKSLFL